MFLRCLMFFQTTGLAQLRWISKGSRREGTPVQGWSQKLVEKAMAALVAGGNVANVLTEYPLTFQDLGHAFTRKAIVPVVETLNSGAMLKNPMERQSP